MECAKKMIKVKNNLKIFIIVYLIIDNITPGKPIYALLSNKPVECKTSNIDPRFISTA